MAERLGSEPRKELPLCRFSRPVLSTAQPSLREQGFIKIFNSTINSLLNLLTSLFNKLSMNSHFNKGLLLTSLGSFWWGFIGRFNDYIQSFAKWCSNSNINDLIFLENSGFDLTQFEEIKKNILLKI